MLQMAMVPSAAKNKIRFMEIGMMIRFPYLEEEQGNRRWQSRQRGAGASMNLVSLRWYQPDQVPRVLSQPVRRFRGHP